jgi:glycosyltransferase involved in cell wall biosynthesis
MSIASPLVSIGLPVYNGESLLERAVDSLLAQTFRDFELIISDNASTDSTPFICQRYADSDSRVRYFRNDTNLGGCANAEIVHRKARGCYFMFGSHDDYWYPEFIEKCLVPLEKDPKVVLVYPRTVIMSSEGQDLRTYADDIDTRGMEHVEARVAKVHYGAAFRTAIYGLMRRELGLSCLPSARVFAPDHVFLTQMAMHGQFANVPETLFKYTRQAKLVSLKLRSTEYYAYYQRMQEPKAWSILKYRGYWGTTVCICWRVWKAPLTLKEKLTVMFKTVSWCLHQEVPPSVMKVLDKMASPFLNICKIVGGIGRPR